jgi:hypothetical protein
MNKFKLVDISKKYIEQINDFSCGNKSVDKYLKEDAYHDFYSNKNSTKLLLHEDILFGFYSVKIDTIYLNNTEDGYNVIYLNWIAIDVKVQKIGMGQYLLDEFLLKARECVDFLGLFGIALKAFPNKQEWYEKNGFVFIEEVEYDLKLMIIDARNQEHKDYYEIYNT